MTYNLINFKDLNSLIKYYYLKNDIILANRLITFFDKIYTINLVFCIKSLINKILLSKIWYCNKLENKLIFLKIFD